jgi:S1-C subfamily serine protease
VVVDAASGANFEYPSEIKVLLAPNEQVGLVGAQMPASPASQVTTRREFGIRGDVVTTSLASTVQLDGPRGVLVKSVENGGAASAAGLASGDIILTFGGTQIETVADMRTALAAVRPNSRVLAEIWRGGRDVPITFHF